MKIVNQFTKIIFGKNSLESLQEIVNSKIIVICDKILVETKLIDKVLQNISSTNEVIVFDDVKPDPPLSIVSKAMASIIKNQSNIIIAFGGGSSIDTAKGAIYFLKQKYDDYNFNFIAIPTTSGTGSEVTSVTVITDEEQKIKHVISSQDMLPNIAILDSSLTKTLPKSVVANTGIDVLTHSMEAYVARGANEYSDSFAEKSAELIFKNLYSSYANNDDYSREKMIIASNLAGNSFNIAGLGVNHSIAHQIGSVFHLPHGLANAIVLIPVIDCNCKCSRAKKKYAKFSREIGLASRDCTDEDSIRLLKASILSLIKLLDMPVRISECGIELQDWNKNKQIMADNALKDRCLPGNPIDISKKEILEILDKIY